MKNDDVVNIYWSPFFQSYDHHEDEMTMLFKNPTNLFNELIQNKSNSSSNLSIFSCPAFKQKTKNTYVFRNSLESEYKFKVVENNVELSGTKENQMNARVIREPSLSIGPQVLFDLQYLFFSDQQIEADFSQPTFHQAKYTNYGTVIPGSFNIGSWFRPFAFEVQMWSNEGKFIVEEDEPIFYVNFKTDKKIKLHRFNNNPRLDALARHCVRSPNLFGQHLPLWKRYKRFNETSMREIVLNEIKNNLVIEEEN